jgi:hypothetical protein
LPRHLVILLVWLTGALLLLGAWGHSLLMKSYFVYRSPGLERHFQIGLAAGSLTVNIHAERPLFHPGFLLHTDRWQDEPDPFSSVPPQHTPPTCHFGRLRTSDGYLETPLWLVLLGFTIALLPLYLRDTEDRRPSNPEILIPDDDPDAVETLNFKLY